MKRLVFIVFVLIGQFCIVNGDQVTAVLKEAFDTNKIEFSAGLGTIKINGNPIDFKIECFKETNYLENEYIVLVVVFPKIQWKYSKIFIDTNNVKLPKHKSMLIISKKKQPFDLVKKVIDERALATGDYKIEIDDYISNGTLQVKMTGVAEYGLANPSRLVSTKRYYLYGIPKCNLLFVATIKKIIASKTVFGKIEKKRIDFVQGEKGNTNNIEVIDLLSKKKQIILFRNGKYDYLDDKPWEHSKDMKKIKNKVLRIEVMDIAGTPIKNASIRGYLKEVNRLKWSEETTPINTKTDENGKVTIPVKDSIYITIAKDCYYPIKKGWRQNDIPEDTVVITLEKEHLPVKMLKCNRVRKIWEKDKVLYEIGIVFLDDDRKAKTIAKISSNDSNTADIWIKIDKGKEKDWKNWDINLTSKTGWKLALGPKKEDSPYGDSMRVAPLEGYKEELSFKIKECPEGFYIKTKDGKKYGKMWGMRFEDRSRGESVRRYLWVRYMVQAEEGETRSLNPIRKY